MKDPTPAAEPRSENILFRFGIVTDSHLGPEQPGHSSPWRTNRLANARSRYVVRELNRLAPDFVIHLGDLVHPVPILPSYSAAAERFHEIYGALDSPLHLVPGNHDLGDKPGAYMPAAIVDDRSLERYVSTFGATFTRFERCGCRFLLLNTPVLNTELAIEHQQRDWLERTLAEQPSMRTFLCLHYPLYLTEPGEQGHYENLDEPARSWLLSLIGQYEIEAVFAGHTHTFFYNRQGNADLYVLPSVTSVRQDYSELFRKAPDDDQECGRNDTGKLGFSLVTVTSDGHDIAWVPTSGAALIPDAPPPIPLTLRPRPAPLAVDLRHPWAEVVELPYNYLTDAFTRKRIRNDYPLLALWQLGVDRVRVPLGDLVDARVRERMEALVQRGMRFTILTLGVPRRQVEQLLVQHRALVDALEIVLPWEEAPGAASTLERLRASGGFRLILSPLDTSGQSPDALNRGHYYIRHGFTHDALEFLAGEAAGAPWAQAVDAIGWRLAAHQPVWKSLAEIAARTDAAGFEAHVTMHLAADGPADQETDDPRIAGRVAEAAFAASCFGHLRIVVDTFADNDRGYFVRHGLVDRQYNLRPAGRVLRHWGHATADTPTAWEHRAAEKGNGLLQAAAGDVEMVLMSDHASWSADENPHKVIDLSTGAVVSTDPSHATSTGPWLGLHRRCGT